MQIGQNLNILLHGHVDDVEPHYEQADLFVYCSTFDALPNVLMEAQSHELAILVNRAEFLAGVLEENQHALFFDLDNGSDFSDKLRQLLAFKWGIITLVMTMAFQIRNMMPSYVFAN